ncbi:hypothetical protein [Hydrotalea sp.]|uniref:hypothetical protein n=1 Tax=Hydrotalea sp. TaxID=2881279 RepID=UPI00260F3D27|nr:hypothetical protein [Hydrotalea sp.]
MKAIKNISNLSELNDAIQQLKQEKRELETNMALQWDILQEHYPVLIKNAVFKRYPLLKKSNILITLLGIPAIQQNVERLLLKAGAKAENLLDKWINHLLNRKEDNSTE